MTNSRREISTAGLLWSVLAGYLVLVAAGVLFFRFFALDTGLKMNFDRSLFWSVNALTLSGLDMTPNGLRDFSPAGIVGVYLMMLLGSLFAMIVGGHLVCHHAGLPHHLPRIALAAVILVFGASLFGAGLLMEPERSFASALFEATSAVSNTGLSLDTLRTATDWHIHLVIIPLAALGAIGMPVLLEIFDRLLLSKPLSAYSQRALGIFFIAWLAGFALLLATQWQLLPFRENVVTSWIWAINTRSLGADIHMAGALPRLTWWIFVFLMFAGGLPGGAASGVRLLPLANISRGPAVFLAIYLGAAITLFLLLLAGEPQLSTDRVATIAAAAICNTGLLQDPLTLSTRGLVLLSGGMLAGFLLPLRYMHLIVNPRS